MLEHGHPELSDAFKYAFKIQKQMQAMPQASMLCWPASTDKVVKRPLINTHQGGSCKPPKDAESNDASTFSQLTWG